MQVELNEIEIQNTVFDLITAPTLITAPPLNCLWGNALKRSPGVIRKSRVSYPGPGFLSSATWPLLLKKHYNGLN